MFLFVDPSLSLANVNKRSRKPSLTTLTTLSQCGEETFKDHEKIRSSFNKK